MPLASLELRNVGPFDGIRFDFDPQVNVFIGPNNSGKTTVLLELAALTAGSISFPQKLVKPGAGST